MRQSLGGTKKTLILSLSKDALRWSETPLQPVVFQPRAAAGAHRATLSMIARCAAPIALSAGMRACHGPASLR